MGPKCLGILGVGLLGGSIGLAVRDLLKDCSVVGYGHRRATLESALAAGALDQAKDTAAEAVRGADLVILCTPVGVFRSILQEIAPALAPGAIVTDVGSTKRSVVSAAEQILPPHVSFVGSHPMAGSEQRGVEFAAADLFRDAVCITTPTQHTSRQALSAVEDFWRLLGMHVIQLAPAEHDRRLADVSHLPHAVAAALMTIQEDDSLPLAGKGFRDSTRISGGDGGLWRDIFIDNRDNLRDSIRRLRAQLERLETLLDRDDAEAVKSWLDAAASRRRELKGPRRNEGPARPPRPSGGVS